MTKVYSYVRFSTPEQEKGDSIRRQVAAAEAWAIKHGYELDAELRMEDKGVSAWKGRNARTGALGTFIRAIDEGLVPEGSILLVENLDRVSRDDPWEAFPLFQQIINAGITIVTLMDGERTYSREEMRANPYKIMESLIVMMRANEESQRKATRLREAWKRKRALASSKLLTARAPAWLRLDPGSRQLVVIEDRAEIVRGIFAMTLGGVGKDAIAKNLNLEGVQVFGDGGRRGKHWHRSYVAKILTSPTVVGTLVPHETYYDEKTKQKRRRPLEPVKQYYPAIVDEETFNRVQAMFTVRASARGRHATKPVQSIVAGLAKCPLCGSAMTRKSPGKGHGRPTLVCARAKSGAGCEYRTVPLEHIEGTLIERRIEMLEKMPANERAEELSDEIKSVEDEIVGWEESLDALIDQLSFRSSPAIRERVDILERDLSLGRKRLDALVLEKVYAHGPSLELKTKAFISALEADPLDRAEANVKLRELCREVVVDWTQGVLQLRWHQGGETELQYGWPDEEWLKRARAAE